MILDTEKNQFRKLARSLRIEASHLMGDQAGQKLRENFTAAMKEMNFPKPGAAVAGYRAMGSEIDPALLLQHLCHLGYVCGFPDNPAKDAHLTFLNDQGVLSPHVVLCPLLAFDRQGSRLGQGGGHYDRTLEALGKEKDILAVGLAFEAQYMENIPQESHDQRLDWVVTEENVYHCGAIP